MRTITARFVLVATLMALSQYSVSSPVPQQDQNKVDMQSMSVADLEKAVETADEKTLATNASLVAHVGAHNAYHIGQILYVRKLQGAWDPAKGVK